jgi:hypothetical protein
MNYTEICNQYCPRAQKSLTREPSPVHGRCRFRPRPTETGSQLTREKTSRTQARLPEGSLASLKMHAVQHQQPPASNCPRHTGASVHIHAPGPCSLPPPSHVQPPRSIAALLVVGSPWPLRSALLPRLLLLLPALRSQCRRRRRPTTTRRSRCRSRFRPRLRLPRSPAPAGSPPGRRRGRRTSSSPGRRQCGRRRPRGARRRAASAASASRRGRRCSATCGATRSASGAG